MKTSILILSGGLDSAVSSWIAREETNPVLALTFDYGQKAAACEKRSAAKLAKHLGVKHRVISLPWLKELTHTALVSKKALPYLRENQLDEIRPTRASADAVWVPNRNGLFLNIAACFAESLKADFLITGFNAEEAVTFPDNSAPFVKASDEFFWYSTQTRVKVKSFTLSMTKNEIAKKAAQLKIPLRDLWFCYTGGKKPCGRCESCLRDFRAFREAGLPNPWSKK